MNLIDFLLNVIENPLLYSITFLIYVISAAIILPIPVEIGLFNPYIHPLILIGILSVGKGIGALIVFIIGSGIRKKIKRWGRNTPTIKKFIKLCERFIIKHGYIGLFIIMSIPFMVDSISLYFFSLLNPQEVGINALTRGKFVIINMIAGATRGIIIIAIAYLFGIRLF